MKTSWQQSLANCIQDIDTLLHSLQLTKRATNTLTDSHFPLRVSHEYVQRIEPGNPDDPLLRQILPLTLEQQASENFQKDPLQETKVNPIPGLLHKYRNRVLVLISSACAIHCRYCFRRYFPYKENNPGSSDWQKAFNYIQNNTALNEVILSGGDPLTANDQTLKYFVENLSQIAHIQRLRIHTRLPIAIPQRITTALIETLTNSRLKPIVVIHCNHPQEIDHAVVSVLKKLHQAGITLLNQAVLLKGVNDNAGTLIELSEKLFTHHVQPYYLHLLDKVTGAEHFNVNKTAAIQLINEVQRKTSGYLVPKLVTETSNTMSKTILS